MKFSCNKQDLAKAIAIVIRASYRKMQHSILECIHIRAEETRIVLNAFDGTTAMQTVFYGETQIPGEAAVPARLLQEIVSKLPEGKVSLAQTEENSIQIVAAHSKATLQQMDASQFPPFPNIQGGRVSLPQKKLKEMVEKTAFSAYTGEDKPIFTGLLFEGDDQGFQVVAIDGIRLARLHYDMELEMPMRIVIPARVLKEMVQLLEEEGMATLVFGNSVCFLLLGDTTLYTRLLDGQFLDYRAILPSTCSTKVKIERKLLAQSLEMVSVLAREDRSNLVKMKVEEGQMTICANSEYGQAENQIPIEMEGEVLTIAFNAKYIMDIMKAIEEEEEIFMEFDGRLKPCIIRPLVGEQYLYMVVPINVRE